MSGDVLYLLTVEYVVYELHPELPRVARFQGWNVNMTRHDLACVLDTHAFNDKAQSNTNA